jgi:microcystin-dependent protein
VGEPFLGEVKIVSFNFAPKGWALANGQLLPINQNQALFSLYGTTFGGDGRTTFAIPEMRGRVAIHRGNSFTLGETGGEENHTLTLNEMPAHTHTLSASTADGNNVAPGGNFPARQVNQLYAAANSPPTAFAAGTVGSVGGSQPHANTQPYLVLNFICALQGIFPSRN